MLMEAGLDGFMYYVWYGMFAPDGTPKAAIKRVHDEPVKISRGPANQKKLLDQGLESWIGTSARFDKFVSSETVRWKQVMPDAGILKLKQINGISVMPGEFDGVDELSQ